MSNEVQYCADARHDIPCQLPCAACAEECEPGCLHYDDGRYCVQCDPATYGPCPDDCDVNHTCCSCPGPCDLHEDDGE